MEIVDISNPALPVHASALKEQDDGTQIISVRPFNMARSIFFSEDKVYITSRTSHTVSIIDVANPKAPAILSTVVSGTGGALLTEPGTITVAGDYAYVGSALGFEIIDVANPSLPSHKSNLVDVGTTVAITVSGDYAYLAHGFEWLNVVDISNPVKPVLSGQATIRNSTERYLATDLSVFSGWAYMTVGTKGMSPVLPPGQVGLNGIKIINVTDPLQPVLAGTFKNGTGGALLNNPSSIYTAVINNRLYAFVTSSGSNALEILDINVRSNPFHKGSITHGTGGALLQDPASVVVSGNYAYVASRGSNALEIIDISNPALPVHKSSITHGTGGAFLDRPIDVYISGKYAYVTVSPLTENGALEVIDISDPSNPKHHGVFLHGTNGALLDGPNSLVISGNYGYISNYGLYENVDIVYLYGPKVSDFTPSTGAVGTSVTITGQNFNTFITASVNGVPANITKVTATSLTLTVPPGATNGKIILGYQSQRFASATNFIVTPTTSVATEIKQTSFTANWSDVIAAGHFFDLSTDNFATYVEGYNNRPLGNVTSLAITGLNSATTYQYRIRSSDGATVSDHSNTTTVATLAYAPVANEALLITENSFNANWSAISGVSEYFLDIAKDESFTTFLVGYNNLTIPATNQSQIVNGLSPYTSYYYRVRAANVTGSSPSSNVIRVTTLDITAPAISNSIAPNSTTLTAGASPALNSTITDNVSVDSAQLFYRGISKSSFKKVSVQGPGGLGGNYSVTVQPEWYDSLGMEYYFVAKDKAGNKTIGAKSFIQLINPSISLPTLPSGSDQSDYRIIALPYQLTDNKVTSVYNNIPWSDNTKAGLWWWNPNLNSGVGDYDQYTPTGSLQTIDPGKGYWAITGTPVTPTLSNVPAPKYNQSNLYSMTLKPGWNEVGNPYPVSISWDEVRAYNSGAPFSPLTIYNGGYKEAKGATLLSAFEGGFVKNNSSSDIIIQIPFRDQVAASGRIASISSDITNDDWNIPLHINQNGRTNQLGGFGMHRSAQAGIDRFDNFNPPAFLGIPEVNFINEEYPALSFSNDMVTSQDNYTWTFTPNGKEGSLTQLVWNNELNMNSFKQLFLLDEEQLTVIDMNEVNQYDFVLTKSSRFRIFYGSEVKITTSRIMASAPFPNPLIGEGKTTINIALPESGSDYSINMQVYGGQGDVIGSVNKRLTPGIHPLEFSLSPALSGGIYIYKLAVTNEKISSVHTGKIVKP